MFDLTVRGGDQFDRLSRQLRSAGRKDLRAALVREMRKQVKPAETAVKSAAMALPGAGDPAARRKIAAATASRVRTTDHPGVRVVVRSDPLGTKYGLPMLMNRGPWQHPTFGHAPIVTQISDPGWFTRAMRGAAPNVRRALLRGMRSAGQQIARSIRR